MARSSTLQVVSWVSEAHLAGFNSRHHDACRKRICEDMAREDQLLRRHYVGNRNMRVTLCVTAEPLDARDSTNASPGILA